jgi:DNA-binding GntR family transcriptional regulator
VSRSFDEQAIHAALSQALLSGRLAPGVKLGEHRLASIFGVTRERIRKVLHRLGHERLIDVVPNRGAFVASPGLDDAREIYEARRIAETGIVWRLAKQLAPAQLGALRAHLADEERAHRAGDRAEAIRLSGSFHTLLAEMTGNPLVVRQMRELVARTSMLVAFFECETAPGCGVDEHEAILAGLARGDPAEAARAMVAHLSLVETRLQPRAPSAPAAGVDEALQALVPASRSRRPAVAGLPALRARPAAPATQRRGARSR